MMSSVAACADTQMSAAKLAASNTIRFMVALPKRSIRGLLRPRPLFVIIQFLLQRRIVHADQERRLFRGGVIDQREARRRERIAVFPGERLAVDRRLARAFDD